MIKRSKVLLSWFIISMIIIIALITVVMILQPEYVANF